MEQIFFLRSWQSSNLKEIPLLYVIYVFFAVSTEARRFTVYPIHIHSDYLSTLTKYKSPGDLFPLPSKFLKIFYDSLISSLRKSWRYFLWMQMLTLRLVYYKFTEKKRKAI